VTGNYFQVLGVRAALGRTLSPADAPRPTAEPVIVLSHRGWERLFQKDPAVIGKRVLINGSPSIVIGVMPEGFFGLDSFGPDYWAPLTMVAQYRPHMAADNPHSLEIIGRLKPGTSVGAARAALAIWASQTADGRPANHQPEDLTLQSRRTGTPLSLGVLLGFSPLFAAFGLVLIIACANIANLLLARAFARQREIGVRLSLGASRGRIVRQLLTESLLLALAAAACALVISRVVIEATVRAIVTTIPQDLAEYFQPFPPAADFRVVAFVVVAAVAATAVFGLLPALRASRPNLLRVMSAETAGDVRPARARDLLVIAQVTSSALLLITAGIFLRGAIRAAGVDPGLRVSDTIVIEFDERLRPPLLDAVMAEPSVASVAAVWPGAPLFSRAREAMGAAASGNDNIQADYRMVSPNYFEVFGVPIVAGRTFSAEEAGSRAAVAVVSQRTARELWPNGTAIGQILRLTHSGVLTYENDTAPAARTFLVVGVTRDVPGYRFGFPDAGVFLPAPVTTAGAALVVRTAGDVHAARRALLSRLTAIDPNLRQIMTMGTLGALLTYPLQAGFWTTVALGAIALTLTVSGIFGVLSYLVVQRTKEIGVRIALGATTGRVIGLVLWQSLKTVGVGLTLGTALASGLAALFNTLPVAAQMNAIVHVFDPVAYAGALLSILAACVAAALVPSLRAACIDPIATLRHD
jgi:predicted permease